MSKRAPSKSLDLHRICIRFSPQEPRRPRFSFFHLHAVKELTPVPLRAGVIGSWASEKLERTRPSPGCPAASLPFQKSLNSGSEIRSASSTWRDIVEASRPVNTHLEIPTRSETSGSPSRRAFAGARLVSGGRYIWAPIFPVNTVSDQIGRVRKSKGSGRLTSAARLAYTKTRPACHMLVANRVRNRLIDREEPSLAAILDHSTLGVVR